MHSLKGKLILSYLAVALITVLVVSGLIRLTSGQSLMSLVVEEQTASLSSLVQQYYTANGSLDGFFEYYQQVDHKSPPPPQPGASGDSPDNNKHNVRGILGLVDGHNRALIPTQGYAVGQVVPQEVIHSPVAVEVDGTTVAWILPDTGLQFQLSPEEKMFLQRTTLAIGLAALAGVLAAVAMGFFLAGGLLKPIRLLTRASQALARGSLNQQVPVTSQDELGVLTTTFNQMSAGLAQADEQRKRMTADITHDLSTPLQIISGYIEMLEDGEVTLTPQRIEILKTELGHLRRLVGDLGILTQVEAGGLEIQLEPVHPAQLLERVYHAFQPIAARQGVELVLEAAPDTPPILVDHGRIEQVLKNLLENALRYTPRGGVIRLGAQAEGRVTLWVSDSGAGIDAEDLPYVFDRFYRADKTRGASPGKMGLGLAICKALVNAQGGEIAAQSAGKGQGTRMVITFDAAPAA
ncbi:MAG: ATP-binding protein [Anaerolineaceae bacterium]|nr:ATP-binding protein [Anaerolineaceae bacterium]